MVGEVCFLCYRLSSMLIILLDDHSQENELTRNSVLIPKDILEQQQQDPNTIIPLFVIDWELAQCGARALDLGQMFAELYFVKHFRDVDAGPWIIQGLARAYPYLTEAMAYRVAIHVGVHFVCWGTMITDWGTEEQVRRVVELGRDLIVKGWRKERGWFEGGFWGCLFGGDP